MALLLRSGMSENFQKKIENHLAAIVFDRCRWIIPAVLILIFIFIVFETVSLFWGELNKIYFYTDTISLINFSFIYCLFLSARKKKTGQTERIQFLVQHATSGSIIIYSAIVAVFDPNSIIGYSTFIVGLMFVGALMYLRPRRYLAMALGGIVTQLLIYFFFRSQVGDYGIERIGLFLLVIVVSLLINRFNTQLIIKDYSIEQDLEERVRERTNQLEEETRKAHEADEMKTVFLATMSHEIRTPLNGIIGFSNLMRVEKLKDDQRNKYLDIVIASGKNLLDILNGILEVSKIESGETEVFIEHFSLNAAVSEVIRSFMGHSKLLSGNISLINLSTDIPVIMMSSDRLKLVQILSNLINNSIKYSDEGTISIEYNLVDEELIDIAIIDTGIGMDESEVSRIFDRFQQLKKNPYAHSEGVGLGLTIVKSYLELLGGKISVTSKPGEGSEFRISLPLNSSASTA